MTAMIRLTNEDRARIEHCPCGHNAYIQHNGLDDRAEPGCGKCDCGRSELEAAAAAVEAIVNTHMDTLVGALSKLDAVWSFRAHEPRKLCEAGTQGTVIATETVYREFRGALAEGGVVL